MAKRKRKLVYRGLHGVATLTLAVVDPIGTLDKVHARLSKLGRVGIKLEMPKDRKPTHKKAQKKRRKKKR